MVYECDSCSKALPPGVTACPNCGETFEDVVPSDAEVPKRGFSQARPHERDGQPETIVLGNPLVPNETLQASPKPPRRSQLQPSANASARETIYLQNADVTVSNTRIVIKGKTYATANVTSVVMIKMPPEIGGGCLGSVVGAILLAAGLLASSNGTVIVGLVILVVAILIAAQKKPKYFVRIVSASSESNALWAYNSDYIQQIVNAINEAIINRG